MSKPKVEVLPIAQAATPDPNNVNKHTQKGGKLLGNSLRKRGAFRSIASAGKGVDVPVVGAGNFTLENAVDAGFTEVVNIHVNGNQLVNVVRDDIAPGSPEFYALAIEDNEIGKQSYSPDLDIVAALAAGDSGILSALKNEDKVFGGILEGMGLKEETKDAEPQMDRAVELLKKWGVQTGDLWQIGEHRLLCGDCTDAAVVARVMEGEDVAMVTDPPYGIGYEYTDHDDSSNEENNELVRRAFEHAPVVKIWTCGIMNTARELGCYPDAKILCWHKGFAQAGSGLGGASTWEPVLVVGAKDANLPNDYLHYPTDRIEGLRGLHSCPKPVALFQHLIEHLTHGDIYEPFSGSGTTLVACQNLNRRGRAIEISPAYCAVTLERMATAFPDLEIKKL